MSEREIGKTIRIRRAAAAHERAERRAWRTRSAEERILEVESLRRMWIEVTGDPDAPIQRVIQRRPINRRGG